MQNRLLTEAVIAHLEKEDFLVLTHSLVPSLGQAAVAAQLHAAGFPS